MQLLGHFFRREFRSRYLGSMSGLLWAVLHPALQLAMYALVFEQIFKARIAGAEAHGMVAYIGVGFWAWTLFAESSARAAPSVIHIDGDPLPASVVRARIVRPSASLWPDTPVSPAHPSDPC